MTTGSPIYLVTACASAEEFVAAFRRYADRTGLFIPIAEPFAVGKRVWVAIALTGGGVMIEGVAEIIQASAKPSALHGRIGMTLRFLEPDAPSKAVLGELEKARLAMKLSQVTVAPRPATIAAEPRPTPPPVGGRIDAANALAECVAIGDLTGVRPEPPKAGQRFVVPPISSERGKTGTVPPTTQPGVAVERAAKGTSLGVAPLGRPRVTETQPASVVPPPKLPVPTTSPGIGVVPAARSGSTDEPPATPTSPQDALAALIRQSATHDLPAATPTVQLDTLAAFAPHEAVTDREVPAVIASTPPREDPPPRKKPMTAPPRYPTPVAPLPIVRPPAQTAQPFAAMSEDLVEPTELSNVPPPDPSSSMRTSEIMAVVAADDDWTMTPDAPVPTVQPRPLVIESTEPPQGPPTGDWTMTKDPAGSWTEPAKVDPNNPPPSGNVVEAVSAERPLEAIEDRPTSIGPNIEIDPSLMEPLARPSPPPGHSSGVMTAYPVGYPMPPGYPAPPPGSSGVYPQASLYPQAPAPATGPMPLYPPAALEAPQPPALRPAAPGTMSTPNPLFAAPPALPGVAPHPAPPLPGVMPPPQVFAPGYAPPRPPQLPPGPPIAPSQVPARMDPTDGGTGFFYESGQVPRYPTDAALTALADRSRKRLFIIIGAALGIALLVVVIVTVAGGHKPGPAKPAAVAPPPVAPLAPGSAGSAIGATPGSAMVEPAVDAGVAATCTVEVTSVPPGADVMLDETKPLGTTPGSFDLPCDTAVTLIVRKARFTSVTKDVTPAAGKTSLAVRLSHLMYSVKVTSTPAGATITVGGRMVGVTPTTIKLPALESSTLTLSKDGYAPDSERITARQNNASLRVTLKKGHKLR